LLLLGFHLFDLNNLTIYLAFIPSVENITRSTVKHTYNWKKNAIIYASI